MEVRLDGEGFTPLPSNWTTVTNGIEWHTLSVINEYWAAVMERAWAIGQIWPGNSINRLPNTLLVAGDEINQVDCDYSTTPEPAAPDYSPILLMQWALNYNQPIDDVSGYLVLAPDFIDVNLSSSPPSSYANWYYTASTYRTATGLVNTADSPDGYTCDLGWRRIPKGAGTISGDYDSETTTTTITCSGGTPFTDDMVTDGCKIYVVGAGDFTITSKTSTSVCTVNGKMKKSGQAYWIIPGDWTDYDDAAYVYGWIQQGDVIGPWIFADLQAACNALIWTLYDTSDWVSSASPGESYTGVGGPYTNWSDARDEAETDWHSNGASSGGSPYAYALVSGSGPYTAQIQRRAGVQTWAVPTAMEDRYKNLAYYLKPSAYGTFDANGETLTEGAWTLWREESSITGETDVSSAAFGSSLVSTMPNWSAPVDGGQRGYLVTDPSVVIVKWNVTDGFDYW